MLSRERKNLLAVLVLLGVLTVFALVFVLLSKEPAEQTPPPQEEVTEPVEQTPPQEESTEPPEEEAQQPEEDYTPGGIRTVELSVPIQGDESGAVLSFSIDLPSEWRPGEQEETAFYDAQDDRLVSDGYEGYQMNSGSSLWASAKVWKNENHVSAETLTIQGQEVLMGLSYVSAEEASKPEQEQQCCYSYYLPQKGSFLLIRFYSQGKWDEAALEQHKEILESIQYHG